MPCYTISYVSVKVKAENDQFIRLTLDRLGLQWFMDGPTKVRIPAWDMKMDLKSHEVTVPTNMDHKVNEFNRSYAETVLLEIAKKKHWVAKKTDENQYRLRRY